MFQLLDHVFKIALAFREWEFRTRREEGFNAREEERAKREIVLASGRKQDIK